MSQSPLQASGIYLVRARAQPITWMFFGIWNSVQENNPEVLGAHEFGGNRYVMYTDGSVEAETPDGSFRFSSLDELQAALASSDGRLQGGR